LILTSSPVVQEAPPSGDHPIEEAPSLPAEASPGLSEEEFNKRINRLAKIIKGAKGLPLDPDSVITQLTNIKEILERSRYPTYSILRKQVYYRLIYEYFGESAKACLKASNLESSALIAYKGQSRSEIVEMNKQQAQASQQFVIGPERQAQAQAPQAKSHFWNRKSNENEEFKE
jgi:hypothetical protein